MKPKITIRNETDADVLPITEVTVAAFETLEISDHTEQYIIMALRAAKALSVSLVAEVEGRVVGHIAFSPVTISGGTRNWYGLGPVSVQPAYQRQGIGTALIREGLARLKDLHAQGCCLVGHPEYYRKFGFSNAPGLVLAGVPPEYFFALAFDGPVPRGTVEFHEGFKADGRQLRKDGGAEATASPPTGTLQQAHHRRNAPSAITQGRHAMAHNPVIWFEIYVQDMERAKRFYEAVFAVTLERLGMEGMEMWSFPMEMDRVGAGGALVKMEGVPSGGNSTVVYFTCEDCAVEEGLVEQEGGRVQQKKMAIGEYGFISLVYDPEGNMIGLHSMK